MNTKAMFSQAQKLKLTPMELCGHAAWALVAQSGRPPMTVGEIAKHIALTSGVKPSAYQVRSLMEAWALSETSYRYELRKTPVAPVIGYTGGENAVLILASLVHVFIGNNLLWDAINAAVRDVRHAAIKTSNAIYDYNQEMDQAAIVTQQEVSK